MPSGSGGSGSGRRARRRHAWAHHDACSSGRCWRPSCGSCFELLPAHIALVGWLQRKPVGAAPCRRIFTPTPLAATLSPRPFYHRHRRRRRPGSRPFCGEWRNSGAARPYHRSPASLAGRGYAHGTRATPVAALPSSSTLSKTSEIAACTRRSGSLLEAVAGLHKASDRGRHDEFAATRPSRSERQASAGAEDQARTRWRTSLEPQQQSVVAVPGRVDRLLIDKNCIDDATHLDQLLPIPAVAGEARDFPSADRADLAEADLGHHPFGNRRVARRRPPSSRDRRRSLRSRRRNPAPSSRSRMAYCNASALAVVQHLMSGGLAYVEDRLALQVMGPDLVSDHGQRPRHCWRRCSPAHARGSGVAISSEQRLLRVPRQVGPIRRARARTRLANISICCDTRRRLRRIPIAEPSSSLPWVPPRFWSREIPYASRRRGIR